MMTKAYAVYFNQGMDIDAQGLSEKQLRDLFPHVVLEGVWTTEKGAQKFIDGCDEENQEVEEMHERLGIEHDDEGFYHFIREVDIETFDLTGTGAAFYE